LNITGHTTENFDSLRETFASLWDEIEVGASLCVFKQGVEEVNLYGGYTDRECTQPWQSDTLVCTYSTTKGIVAIAVANLVDKGLLDYSAKVSDYWPEFSANNKQDITVSQLLSHQAGLYRFEPAVTVADLYDWEARTKQLAGQAPSWEPGAAFGYHTITWGYLAGELIRRVTEQSPGEYIREYITAPVAADCYLGVPPEALGRCATMIGPNHARKQFQPNQAKSSVKKLSTNDPIITPFRDASSDAWRQAEIPASNLHATAQALARIYAGTLERTSGQTDLVLAQPLRRSNGFILNCEDCFFGASTSAYGHSGTGGSIAFADPDNQIAFAYVMNQLHHSGRLRYRKLIESLYQCL
jgi:CubicO group peptidase (beta-lactamase class C family)